MVYGVLSDVHSNLEAFAAVVAELPRYAVEKVLFLGDIVGYGGDPNACVELLERLGARSVRGNHDRMVAGGDSIWEYGYSSDEVRDADLLNRKALTPANMGLLRGLPPGPVCVEGGVLLCHGSPRDEDEYVLSLGSAVESAAIARDMLSGGGVCFCGHTHIPQFLRGGRNLIDAATAVLIEDGYVYIANPGSVGQPRDGDPEASFGVYDSERQVYANHRVRYDVKAAQRKIAAAGLPRRFADRLSHGR